MMTRSRRLRPVADYSDSREREAARSLGASQEQLAAARRTLQELSVYRDEYLRQMQGAGARGLPAQRVRMYQQFLNRLDQAIVLQEQRVKQAGMEMEKKRQAWLERRCRSKAIHKVVSRYRHQERLQDDRREQREQDDRGAKAQRMHRDRES